MKTIAITATYTEILELYYSLSDAGKIAKDNTGIELYEINQLYDMPGDLATLVYQTKEKRTVKQPKIRDLHNKLIAINKESFYLSHIDDIRKAGNLVEVVDRQGNVIYSASPLAVSRWLTRTEKQRRINAWIESNKRQGTDY